MIPIPTKQMRLLTIELNDSFFPNVALNISNQNCPLNAKSFRFENSEKVIVGHLNISSVRNKFELRTTFICNSFDTFLVSETKIDRAF